MPQRSTVVALALLTAVVLAGCSTGAATGGGTEGSGSDGGGGRLDCSGVTTAGYDLFVDPRLTVEPELDVIPLEAGDAVSFTDARFGETFTTYSYSTAYIDDGQAFPNRAAIFVGAEDTGEFSIEGPFAPTMIDGGPYAGFLSIEATTDAGIETIAVLCIRFAASE